MAPRRRSRYPRGPGRRLALLRMATQARGEVSVVYIGGGLLLLIVVILLIWLVL
jgi:hypothetical protein